MAVLRRRYGHTLHGVRRANVSVIGWSFPMRRGDQVNTAMVTTWDGHAGTAYMLLGLARGDIRRDMRADLRRRRDRP